MTVCDEKTPLMSHVVLVVPGEAVAVASVPANVVVAAALSAGPSKGLTNRELIILAGDPFWVRLRALIFWAFWMCWMALFVAAMAVVFTSPRCPELPCDNTTLVTTTATALPDTVTPDAWTMLTIPS